LLIPATVSRYIPQNCYVVSPFTQIVDYSKDELQKIDNPLLRFFCRLLVFFVQWPLRLAKIDSVQVLNNQCLSTNIYPDNWRELDVSALRKQGLNNFPKHALLLRSLNNRQHREFILHLKEDNWLPIVNRQVYLVLDHKKWLAKRDSKRDLKLLNQDGWEFVSLDYTDSKQLQKAKNLYNQLYLEKYSRYNIQFTESFLKEFSKNNLLKIFCLFHQGEMLGVVGLFVIENTLTVPIVGYDIHRPVKLALYRRLVIFTNRYALENNLQINQSAGAPQFKRTRGAEPVIEYNFAYVGHLSTYKQLVWRCLSIISHKIYRPILEKFKL
jgi:hypothetical protein